MKIAIIPARGGSKRIPGKNIIDFCGKPMIAWSIIAAKSSLLFDRIIVSTDDVDIADVAMCWGAEVPFMRPPELSDDYVGTTEVVAHTVRFMEDHGVKLTAACCIYATAPLIDAVDIVRGWHALNAGDWKYAFSATIFSPSIYRAFKYDPNGGAEMLFPEYFTTRSQDLPIVMHDAAQFYWGRTCAWVNKLKIFDHHSVPVQIPSFRTQDIDDWNDLQKAKLLFNLRDNGKSQ